MKAVDGFSATAQGFVSGKLGASHSENPFPDGSRKAINWERLRKEGFEIFCKKMEEMTK